MTDYYVKHRDEILAKSRKRYAERSEEEIKRAKEKRRIYYLKTKAARQAYYKKYYAKNRERIIAHVKDYFERTGYQPPKTPEFREKRKEYQREYRKKNRDRINEKQRERYAVNREKYQKYFRYYRKQKKEKIPSEPYI